MSPAGYSGTPLVRKLGITDDSRVVALGAPNEFRSTLGPLPAGAWLGNRPEPADIFIVFSANTADMTESFSTAMHLLPPDGAIWAAWPKRSSGVASDLTEDVLRELFLPLGLVDNKVCAIDDTWSGLRFVVRRENRATWVGPDGGT